MWVNALWFLSLVISLTCALLATLLQQWARRYLKITQSRYSPHKQARLRAFFAEGVAKCLLPWAVEILPTLLHTSLFLFFAGLVVFLCNVDLTIFKLILSWVGLCTVLYGCITCTPIIRHDSPYYTPLSLLAWHIVTGMQIFIYRFLRWFNGSVRFRYNAYFHFRGLEKSCRKLLALGMQKTAEETALNSPSEIDTRAFMWTLDCLDEDHELERFFSGLPDFRKSNFVDDPLPSLTKEEKWKLYRALRGLLDRTFSSDFLPATFKNRRAMICARAVATEFMPDPIQVFSVFQMILSRYHHSGAMATGIAQILKGWRTDRDKETIFVAEATLITILARALPRDDSWFILASSQLGVSEALLRDYAGHGDSLSLAILIHIIRQQYVHFQELRRYVLGIVLAAATKFNVQATSPELQHRFCALWNQIVSDVQVRNDSEMAFQILGLNRNVYLALHQDTDSTPTRFCVSTDDNDDILKDPTSYPFCNFPGHHSDSIPLIHDGSVSEASVRTVPHPRDTTALVPLRVPSFIATSPAPPARAPLYVQESLTNAPRLEDNASISVQTRTTTELHSTSPNPVSTGATYRVLDNSIRMTHLSTPEPSTSIVPPQSNASTSSPDAVTIELTAASLTPSRDLKVPSSSSIPVLANLSPIGMHLPSNPARMEPMELTTYHLFR